MQAEFQLCNPDNIIGIAVKDVGSEITVWSSSKSRCSIGLTIRIPSFGAIHVLGL